MKFVSPPFAAIPPPVTTSQNHSHATKSATLLRLTEPRSEERPPDRGSTTRRNAHFEENHRKPQRQQSVILPPVTTFRNYPHATESATLLRLTEPRSKALPRGACLRHGETALGKMTSETTAQKKNRYRRNHTAPVEVLLRRAMALKDYFLPGIGGTGPVGFWISGSPPNPVATEGDNDVGGSGGSTPLSTKS